MTIALTFLIFIVVAVGFALAITRIWLKPKEAIERVTGVGAQIEEDIPVHPSLVFRELLNRLGTVMPASPKDMSVMQRRLIKAGIRNPNALKMLYGAKVGLGVLMPIAMGVLVLGSSAESTNKMLAVAAAAGMGFFGPNEYVNIIVRRRQKQIARALPNALDLMVVCVESGLGLDQDVKATAVTVRDVGAKVMVGPQDIPSTGRFAIVKDPQGAVFAVFKFGGA